MDFNEKLKQEVNEFREYGHKFLNKEVTRAAFKGVSGGMGVYAQRVKDQFMIRLRTPSGLISHKHLNLISEYAEKYNLKGIHLTTRQAVQLHDLAFDNICDIMYDAIDYNLYTRGSGGNFPRNVSISPLSGVEKGEAFDVTPYALQVGEYLMSQITTYKLPRKLKIAFSNGDNDTGKATFNDLGFLAVIENGKPFFKLYLAGGMGNNPAVAIEYGKLVNPEDVLYHVEAITQLFIAEGDYENKAKARLRYVPMRMGVDEFLNCYEKHLSSVKEKHNFNGISPVVSKEGEGNHKLKNNNSLVAQKQDGLYTVILHPLSGQMEARDVKKVTEFINKHENADVRLSMEEEMYIRNLTEDEAVELLNITEIMRETTKIGQSVTCVGVPTCQMGIEKSQELLKNILNTLKERNMDVKYLPQINISGCPNSCSRHQISDLGFAGGRLKVEDVSEESFEVHVGGFNSKEETKLGKVVGSIVTRKIPEFMCDLANELNKHEMNFKNYINEKEDEFINIIKKYIV